MKQGLTKILLSILSIFLITGLTLPITSTSVLANNEDVSEFGIEVAYNPDLEKLNPGDHINMEIEIEKGDVSYDKLHHSKFIAWIEDEDGKDLTDEAQVGTFTLRNEAEDKIETISLTIPKDIDTSKEYILIINLEADELDEPVEIDRQVLSIEKEDYSLIIDEANLRQSGENAITAEIKVTNNGNEDQENIMIKVSSADLNIVETYGPLTLEADETNMRYYGINLPKDIELGTHKVSIKVYSNDAYDIVTREVRISNYNSISTYDSDGIANADAKYITAQKNAKNIFSIEVTNKESNIRTIGFEVAGTNAWADVSIDGPVTLDAGETRKLDLQIIPNSDATGSNPLTIYIKENGEIIDSITYNVEITGAANAELPDLGLTLDEATITSGLKWLFGVLIVIAVILLSVWMWKNNEEKDKGEQVYY